MPTPIAKISPPAEPALQPAPPPAKLGAAHAVWLFLCRVFTWLHLSSGLRRAWTSIYRLIWERRWKNVTVPTYANLDTLGGYLRLNANKWRADSWRQLWDAVSYPGKAKEAFEGSFIPENGLDCEDFSIFIVHTLKRSLDTGALHVAKDLATPQLFTVIWMEGWALRGHAVCLVRLPDYQFAFMDYGPPTGHALTPNEVAKNVMRAQTKATPNAPRLSLVGWARFDENLRSVEVRFGRD